MPYFKFPVQIIFLDQEKSFFKSIEKFIQKTSKYVTITTDLNKTMDDAATSQPVCANTNSFRRNKTPDYNKMASLISNRKRFDEKAVYIVDYALPGMTGIDCLQKIKSPFTRKILLVEFDDYKSAAKAHKDGFIDGYLIKRMDWIKNGLNAALDQAVWEYFCAFSKALFPLRDIHIDKNCIQIFKTWLSRNGIIEFYQCNDTGSYMGLDAVGNIFWLILRTTKQNDKYIEMALNSNLSTDLKREIILGKQLLFFAFEEGKQPNEEDLKKYLFPSVRRFSSDGKRYMYTFVSKNNFGSNEKLIIPFQENKLLYNN